MSTPIGDSRSVLDHGSVTTICHSGSDLLVVNAARVSFKKFKTTLDEGDIRLLNYLASHSHWTPFGHPQITLHFHLPIFVARQFMRSTIGIVYNEVSRRYVDDPPLFHTPLAWRGRPMGSIKQGSGSFLDSEMQSVCAADYEWAAKEMVHIYDELLRNGVAPEQARIVLPLSTYTEFYATFSLAAAARVYSLRIDSHAQWEVQQYASAMDRLIAPLFPHAWKALRTHGVPPPDPSALPSNLPGV